VSTGPLIFVCLCAIALLVVPRRWAPLPFIMAACYVSISQAIEVGPLTFTAIRILVAVGVLRVILRGERLVGGMNGLDWWIVAWAVWACLSVFRGTGELVTRLGLVYNAAGIYFLLRVFCSSIEDVIGLCRATAVLLIPVALDMVYELSGSPSLFYVFEGHPNSIYHRDGRIRAYGPFAHPILAGTIGAVCLPLMVAMWKHRRKTSLVGIIACTAMVISSASSGPIFSAASSLAALAMWRHRFSMQTVRRLAVVAYILLAIAMKAPVYYLIARIDVIGGSTGYHRALLIDAALTHINEWWLAGTDYTRHWAPSPGASPQHTDITNHYISMGVLGGLPLVFLFIGGLAKAFSIVGHRLRETGITRQSEFMLWALGSALFAHMATFLSVSYFDQSFVFLYVTMAAIGSARVTAADKTVTQPVSARPARAVNIKTPARTPVTVFQHQRARARALSEVRHHPSRDRQHEHETTSGGGFGGPGHLQ
jgi:hypothetical protein